MGMKCSSTNLVFITLAFCLVIQSSFSYSFVQKWFENADLNGDKALSFAEAENILPKITNLLAGKSTVLKKDDMNKAWIETDTNKDNKIDFNKFADKKNRLKVKHFNDGY